MKLYILTDIEGVAGVANFEDYSYGTGRFYPQSRHLLTLEVNAAVEGALAAGADDILVWDGHGCGAINVEELHPEVKLLHGSGFPLTAGLDATFDALFFVGQHAMSRAERGGLAHSYSSRTIERISLNGEPIGEFGIRTLLAGHFGVPVVLVTGDGATRDEARRHVPNIEAVVVKESLNLTCAVTLSPLKARDLIRQGAGRALRRRHEIQPCTPAPPYELAIQYKAVEHADRKAQTPGWERLDPFTVLRRSEDFLDVAM
jgi:D-amino peptidase